MLITIKVPDDTVRIMYTQLEQDGTYETDTRYVTAGMIMRVENEDDIVASAAQVLAREGNA